jgi:hypothetical protein
MPVPVINYSAQQPENLGIGNGSGNVDWLGAIERGINLGLLPWQKKEDLQKARLSNEFSRLKNKYAPQQMESELEQGNLANELSRLQLQYQPQIYEQGLERGSLGNDLARLNLKYLPDEKETDLAINKENLRLLPLKFALDQDKLQHQQNRFGNSFKFAQILKNMPVAARSDYIATHAEQYNQMVDDLGNAAAQDITNQQQTNSSPYSLNLTPEQEQNLINSGIASQAPASPFSSSPEDIARIRSASQMSANNALNTMKNRNQMEGSVQFEIFVNNPDFMAKAENASKYAGAVRQGKGMVQKLFQSNPTAQTDYESFKHHDMTAIKNRIKQLEGMGSTDAQREELNDMYDKTLDSLSSNPKRFMTQLGNLKSTMKRVGESVEGSYNKLGYPSQLPRTDDQGPPAEYLQTARGQRGALNYDPGSGRILR